jgi:signal peptidase I
MTDRDFWKVALALRVRATLSAALFCSESANMGDHLEMRTRRPWLAVVLSLFCTGLGHIYSGQFIKGLLLFTVSLSAVPVTFLAATFTTDGIVILGFLLVCLVLLGVYLYAIVNSYAAARAAGMDYPLRDYNHGLVYALFIFMGCFHSAGAAQQVRANLCEAFYIPTASMGPTLMKGDYFIANKMSYRDRDARPGEVVVFRSPANRQMRFVKRIIGGPGDRVSVTDNEIFVNGTKLVHELTAGDSAAGSAGEADGELRYESLGGYRYTIRINRLGSKVDDFPETEIPPGHCFVLGDDRDRSLDSRHFGAVPLGDVLGRALFIYVPAHSWRRLGKIAG